MTREQAAELGLSENYRRGWNNALRMAIKRTQDEMHASAKEGISTKKALELIVEDLKLEAEREPDE